MHGGSLADHRGPRGTLTLPQAPAGGGLVERDGALSITVDDAGAWEERWLSLALAKGVSAMPVPGPRAFRLVVHGAVDAGPVTAVLYGAKLRIAGTAVARGTQRGLRAIVSTAASARAPAQLLEGAATAVDQYGGLRRHGAVRGQRRGRRAGPQIVAQGAAACAGPLAVVPVFGVKLEGRADVPVRGLVVSRQGR